MLPKPASVRRQGRYGAIGVTAGVRGNWPGRPLWPPLPGGCGRGLGPYARAPNVGKKCLEGGKTHSGNLSYGQRTMSYGQGHRCLVVERQGKASASQKADTHGPVCEKAEKPCPYPLPPTGSRLPRERLESAPAVGCAAREAMPARRWCWSCYGRAPRAQAITALPRSERRSRPAPWPALAGSQLGSWPARAP